MCAAAVHPRIRHLIALTVFVVLVANWLSPLLAHPHAALPGSGAGDNLTFVWNLWWIRYAVQHGAGIWHCPFLFFPYGADLTLHTHTALEGVIGAVLFPSGSLVRVQNTWIAVNLYLNFACAYALAWRLTRSAFAAGLAALIFGWSPYLSAHLVGHFNLLAAWILPLVALLAIEAADGASRAVALTLGVALAGAAYLDYYYFVYSCLLVALLPIPEIGSVAIQPAGPSPRRRRLLAALLVVLAADAALIAWIADRGRTIEIGRWSLSLRETANPIAAGWILLIIAALLWLVSGGVRVAIDRDRARAWRATLLAAASTGAVLMAPLLYQGIRMWLRGEYVSQPYFWRSAPPGIDSATAVLGNPFNVLLAPSLQALYARLGISLVEQVGWLGPGAILLAAAAWRATPRARAARGWALCGVVFLVWALGPWLVLVGRNTHLPLPVLAIRYVPIVANARIPGRAMIVVSLAVAILGAIGFAELRKRRSRAGVIAFTLAALVAVDYWPAHPPLYRVESSDAVDTALKTSAVPGAVCELPLGLRDGFGEVGAFDSRVLWHQTMHERPLVGGFVARMPPSIEARYRGTPIIGALLRLSAGGSIAAEDLDRDRQRASGALAQAGIRFVVIDRSRASTALLAYAARVLPLKELAREGDRIAYLVASTSE